MLFHRFGSICRRYDQGYGRLGSPHFDGSLAINRDCNYRHFSTGRWFIQLNIRAVTRFRDSRYDQFETSPETIDIIIATCSLRTASDRFRENYSIDEVVYPVGAQQVMSFHYQHLRCQTEAVLIVTRFSPRHVFVVSFLFRADFLKRIPLKSRCQNIFTRWSNDQHTLHVILKPLPGACKEHH